MVIKMTKIIDLDNGTLDKLFYHFRFMAKTCEKCQNKIVEETLIATNDGKYYCQGCYKQN